MRKTTYPPLTPAAIGFHRIRAAAFAALLLMMAIAHEAAAQPGYLGVYTDTGGTTCVAPDTPNEFLYVYIIHQGTAGAGAVQAALEASNPAGFTHLGETSPYQTTIGSMWVHDEGEGGSVAYGSCVASPNLIKTVNVLTLGTNPTCTSLCVVPDPASLTGTIEVVDCANDKLVGTGKCLWVNSTPTCESCDAAPPIPPVLGVFPISLDFGLSVSQRTFDISNQGGGELSWNVSESLPWLTVSDTGGSGDATITVTVDRSSLAMGVYNGTIDVTSNGGSGAVEVTMTVLTTPPPVLNVDPTSKTLAFDENTFNLDITNAGVEALHWSITPDVAWLSAAPDTGIDGATVLVSADRTGLADGTYPGTLEVTSNGGNTDVNVSMTVTTSPLLLVEPASLVFTSSMQARQLQVSNEGPGILTWTLAPNQPWIDVVPSSGSGDMEIMVTLDVDSLAGPPSGEIAVTSNGGSATVLVNYILDPDAGFLGLYVDAAGTDCSAEDVPNGLLTVYVIHKVAQGAGAVQAGLLSNNPGGFVHLGETSPFPLTIGSMWLHDDQRGGSVAYAECPGAPIQVKTITLMTSGTNPVCTNICVVPDPYSLTGTIEVVDCANNRFVGSGECLYVNADAGCQNCASPTPVHPTTWGSIKAQYLDWNTPEWRSKNKR